jgi:hypothetical protein
MGNHTIYFSTPPKSMPEFHGMVTISYIDIEILPETISANMNFRKLPNVKAVTFVMSDKHSIIKNEGVGPLFPAIRSDCRRFTFPSWANGIWRTLSRSVTNVYRNSTLFILNRPEDVISRSRFGIEDVKTVSTLFHTIILFSGWLILPYVIGPAMNIIQFPCEGLAILLLVIFYRGIIGLSLIMRDHIGHLCEGLIPYPEVLQIP